MTNLEQYEASRMSGLSHIHPVAAVALITAGILIISLQRNKAIMPFLSIIFLIGIGQSIAIAGLDFFLHRILILIGLIRVAVRSEIVFIRNRIDKIIYFLIISTCVVYIFRLQTGASVINRLGYAIDTLGAYILFRSLIWDFEDIKRVLKLFVFLSVVIAAFMIVEQITGKNLISYFGGVSEDAFIRRDRIRSSASFGNAIYAGVFGAIMLPLFVSLWKVEQKKLWSLLGITASLAIVITASSSGPLLAMVAGSLALCMYPLRQYMNYFKWGGLLLLISLHLAMKAPVWALIMRVTVFEGSTAYHRFVLVDQFIRRFDEWWLLGSSSTEHWSNVISTWDVANHYIRTGVDGGLVSFGLLILLISKAFGTIGISLKNNNNNTHMRYFIWAVGSMLITHLFAFTGVSYYGQILTCWMFSIALIAVVHDLQRDGISQQSKSREEIIS